MNCLLCNFQSNVSDNVKKNYLEFHNVDRNNQFFIKLFQKQNSICHGKMCLRCSEFLPSSHFKANHDFLVHYEAGRNVFEEKPVNYSSSGEIRKYEITFDQHSHDYDFYNAEKLFEDFLLNVKNKVGRSDNDFFTLDVVFLWKIYNRFLLKTSS